MDDQHKPEDQQDTVEQHEPTPPAPEAATKEQSTAQARGETAWASPTRRLLLTGGAGLALASGVIGFGIGHATAGDDDQRFPPSGQFVPARGGPASATANDPGAHPAAGVTTTGSAPAPTPQSPMAPTTRHDAGGGGWHDARDHRG